MTIFLQATFEGLALGAVYSLVAIGLVLIYKAMDVLSFAQPALAVVGAGIISALAVDRGINFWVAFIVALIATGIIGALSERITTVEERVQFNSNNVDDLWESIEKIDGDIENTENKLSSWMEKELNKILGSLKRGGFSIVPISLYFSNKGLAKLSFGLGKGKKKYDKRLAIKEKDWNIKKERLLKRN